MKNYFFLFLFIGISQIADAQHTLKVEIAGIKSIQGKVYVGLANNSAHFTKKEQLYKGCMQQVTQQKLVCIFENIPAGTYAISTFHDENNNEELDLNFLGIPKENFGFSNNPRILFKKPSFEDCAFEINGDTALSIQLK